MRLLKELPNDQHSKWGHKNRHSFLIKILIYWPITRV